MKKILAIVTILTVLIVGCGNKENIETEKNRRTETREKTPISKLYDWKQAEIKNIGDGSNFGAEFVVQNEKYIFFPQNGNKVVRLDKNNKNVKTIYKFKESKEKEIGLHLCQGENGFFIVSLIFLLLVFCRGQALDVHFQFRIRNTMKTTRIPNTLLIKFSPKTVSSILSTIASNPCTNIRIANISQQDSTVFLLIRSFID